MSDDDVTGSDKPPTSFLFSSSSPTTENSRSVSPSRSRQRKGSPTKRPVALRIARSPRAAAAAQAKKRQQKQQQPLPSPLPPSLSSATDVLSTASSILSAGAFWFKREDANNSDKPWWVSWPSAPSRKLPPGLLKTLGTALLLASAASCCLGLAMFMFLSTGTPLHFHDRLPDCRGCAANRIIDERPVADWAVSAKALTLSILNLPHNPLMNRKRTGKVAFLFMVQRDLPHQRLWARFFQGHEKLYSIYIHSWEPTSAFKKGSTPGCFEGRDIHERKPTAYDRTSLGTPMRVVDAQRRLLSWALLDPDNVFFVFLSEYCIPLHSFKRAYDYVVKSKQSFLDMRDTETGGLAAGYTPKMKPLVPLSHFATGTPWGTVLIKTHAAAVLADTMFYKVFKTFCRNVAKPPQELSRRKGLSPPRGPEEEVCVPEHHYIQTFLHVVDREGVNARSLTYENTSHLKPRWPTKRELPKEAEVAARGSAVSDEMFQAIHLEKAFLRSPFEPQVPCLVNGLASASVGCYLFARPFSVKQAERLLDLSSSSLLKP